MLQLPHCTLTNSDEQTLESNANCGAHQRMLDRNCVSNPISNFHAYF